MTEEIPKSGIQCLSMALAHSSAVIDLTGTASRHLEVLSTMVKRYENPQGLQDPSGFWTMWSGLAQGEDDRRITPAASMAANSFLADSNFSASRRQAFANTGGPGTIGTLWRTWCLGLEELKPLAQTTSGYYASKSQNS